MARSKVWKDLLFDIVPTDRLRDVFKAAYTAHSSPYPINAYDLKTAWDNLQAEERGQREVEYNRQVRENPVKFCTEPGRHVDPDGNVEVLLGGIGGKEVIVPCPICRAIAHKQRMDDLRQQHAIDHPTTEKEMEQKVVRMFAEAKEKLSPIPIDTDPLQLVGRLMGEVGREMVESRTEMRRSYWHRGYIRLGQIADRIQQQS